MTEEVKPTKPATKPAGDTAPAGDATPPASPAAPAPVLAPADMFEVQGVVTLRGDGGVQGAYNLMVVSPEAQALLEANKAFDELDGKEIQVVNSQGEYWISVKATSGARTKVKSAKSSKVLVTGKVRLVDVLNGRYTGELFEVTAAVPVTLRNGGRNIERAPRERDELEPALEMAARGGAQRGMRTMLNNYR